MTPGSATTRRRLTRGEREERMLDAAEELFGALGFRRTSMDEIAEASGITKALLYQYFDSKDGLYVACVDRARGRLFDEIEEAVAVAEPPERLRAAIETYFEQLDEQRASWFVLYGDAPIEAVNEMRRRNAELLSELIRRAVDENGGSVSDERLDFLGHLLVGAGEQVGRWWLERPELQREAVSARFATAAQAAVAHVLVADA